MLNHLTPEIELIRRRMGRAAGIETGALQIGARFSGKAGLVYDEVELRLSLGQYRFGTAISNIDLGREFGISRAPVTMALNLLQVAGYLVIKPQTGVWVASPAEKEIVAFFQLCARTEALQAQAAALNRSPEMVAILELILQTLEQMGESSDRQHQGGLLTLEAMFQSQIRLMAGMPWLSRHIASNWRMANFLIANCAGSANRNRADENAARRTILSAIREGAADRAAELMERFIADRHPSG